MTATALPIVDASTTTVRAACPHDCPDTCAMLVTVTDGRATKVQGDPDHPYTAGGLCVKVNNYVDRVYDPRRVLHPMRRTGPKGSGQFEQISWDDALTEIASRFRAAIDELPGVGSGVGPATGSSAQPAVPAVPMTHGASRISAVTITSDSESIGV